MPHGALPGTDARHRGRSAPRLDQVERPRPAGGSTRRFSWRKPAWASSTSSRAARHQGSAVGVGVAQARGPRGEQARSSARSLGLDPGAGADGHAGGRRGAARALRVPDGSEHHRRGGEGRCLRGRRGDGPEGHRAREGCRCARPRPSRGRSRCSTACSSPKRSSASCSGRSPRCTSSTSAIPSASSRSCRLSRSAVTRASSRSLRASSRTSTRPRASTRPVHLRQDSAEQVRPNLLAALAKEDSSAHARASSRLRCARLGRRRSAREARQAAPDGLLDRREGHRHEEVTSGKTKTAALREERRFAESSATR